MQHQNNRAKKKAILLMAYGSPKTEGDIEAYYTHIRGGRKPTQEELENLKERYRKIGGTSPLLEITERTASNLQEKLSGSGIPVYAGMKHSPPFIADMVQRMSQDGITDLLSIALAPHYSKMSIGGYQNAVNEANEKLGSGKLNISHVDHWYKNRLFREEWVRRIRDAREKFSTPSEQIFHVFSAHSLPERILTWHDPYKEELLNSMEEIASELRLSKEEYGFAFQSAGHTSEPWLGPDILDYLRDIATHRGVKRVLVAPIGFVSDHLEILFDIDKEAQDLSEELGIELRRTDSFNDSKEFIAILYSVVKESGFLER